MAAISIIDRVISTSLLRSALPRIFVSPHIRFVAFVDLWARFTNSCTTAERPYHRCFHVLPSPRNRRHGPSRSVASDEVPRVTFIYRQLPSPHYTCRFAPVCKHGLIRSAPERPRGGRSCTSLPATHSLIRSFVMGDLWRIVFHASIWVVCWALFVFVFGPLACSITSSRI